MRFICDRIAVIHKGVIVELAECEKLFEHPLHPYTKALLSALPLADPDKEKGKKLIVYKPNECHFDYETNPPTWREIEEKHFILANDREAKQYQDELR